MPIDTTVVANTIQPHFSKKLLEKAIPLLALQQTATQEELPSNIGATSIRFYRPPAPDLTQVGAPAALTEGVAPTNYRDIAYTPIDVTLGQRGQVSKVTDIANNVGLLKYLDTAIDLMSEEFALDMDTLIRNPLCHASTGLTKRYAQGLANFAGTASASLANARLMPRDLLDACTRLTLNRAPSFGTKYAAHLPSQLIRDLLEDATFREVVRQGNATKIFNREVGEFYGCKIVENTNPFQEDETEGTYATTFNAAGSNTTGLIFSAIICGKGAYGTVNMKKMGSTPFKPQVVIVDKPDSGNPLAQYIIAGWKSYNAQVILNSSWGVTLRAKTQFVA
jgi:N4-gp56 family major capsid protein